MKWDLAFIYASRKNKRVIKMTTKQEILASGKQPGFIYPKVKVILAYAFVVPMIGFLLSFLGLLIIVLLNQQSMNNYEFALIVASFIIAFVVAIIPALMMGVWIAKSQIYIKQKKDYVGLFLKGFLCCVVFLMLAILFLIINDLANGLPAHYISSRLYDNFIKQYPAMILFTMIGGISSMLCGKLFLPRFPY